MPIRRPQLFVPAICLDRGLPVPLHGQIRQQIVLAIRNGSIPPGSRLPSSRMLAGILGVSRNTALAAYEELAAEGVISGRRGAGMWVEGAAHRSETALIRAARYPLRVVSISDSDGNPLYLSY